MKNLKYFIILITIFNYLQLIQSDELVELHCLNEDQCTQFQHSGIKASCIQDQCRCTNSNGETVKCQPRNPRMNNIIGGACPCNLPNAECNTEQDICYCVKGYMPSGDKRRCIPKMVPLDQRCEQDCQCQKLDFNAICHESKECKCMEQFVNNEGICASVIVLPGNKSAPVNGSRCSEQYGVNAMYSKANKCCICMPGYFASIDNSQCLKVSNYLEKCNENLQCIGTMGPGAKCMENVCKCGEKYFADEVKMKAGTTKTMCTAVVKRGDYCRSNEDCYQRISEETEPSMDCIYGECNCKQGFISYNDGICTKGSGAGIKSVLGLKSIIAILVFLNKYF